MKDDIYRKCASVVVFRPQGDTYEMLLVHKPRKNDAWQLPQGGCEAGESTEEAAMREVQEEAGIAPELLATSTQAYHYDFPASYRRFRPDNVCGQHVNYVFALMQPGAVVTVDNDEIDDHVWVLPKQLPKYIKRRAYLRLVRRLYEEGVENLKSNI